MSPPPEAGPRRLRDRARDAALRRVHATGWRVAARVPGPVVAGSAAIAARATARLDGPHVQTLRHNLAVATGAPVPDALVGAALRSYLRTFWEVLALPGWSRAEVLARVRTEGEEHLRTAFAGPGAVVALPHSGNWDLAGAWACATGMPVSTVAEQLGEAEFGAFVAFRERLGMEVLSHRAAGTVPALAAALRRGRLVCLVADRDLDGRGLPVHWRGQPVRMPGGPAVVARRSGAVLLPAAAHYEGAQMVLRFGTPVAPRPGRDGLIAMTQDVADFFAEQVAAAPADWHMLQPFFAVPPDVRR